MNLQLILKINGETKSDFRNTTENLHILIENLYVNDNNIMYKFIDYTNEDKQIYDLEVLKLYLIF